VENRPESHNIKIPDQAAYEKYMNALAVQDCTLPYGSGQPDMKR